MKVPAANLHVMAPPEIRTKREPSYSSVQKYVVPALHQRKVLRNLNQKGILGA